MKRIYTTQDGVMLSHLKNLLELQGFRCLMRNYLTGAAGELPPIECWPELWVVDDGQEEEARRALKKLLLFGGPTSRAWRCAGCGEEIPGQFTDCWRCGRARAEYRETS